MKVAILGLGLIGGSLARDLSARGVQVVGYDRSASAMRSARRAGAIAGTCGRGFAEIESCDVCVVAVPVDAAATVLAEAAPRLSLVPCVTDVGSVKRQIARVARDLGLGGQYVGSHPMAGDHRSGWKASRTGLFAGAGVFVSPTPESRPVAVTSVRRLWKSVGAVPRTIGARAHDAFVARASHLPQVASATLALALRDVGVARSQLGPGGRDVTRLAGSDVDVWTAIVFENADRIVPALAGYRRRLEAVERQISRGDHRAISRWMRSANDWFTGAPELRADRIHRRCHWTRRRAAG